MRKIITAMATAWALTVGGAHAEPIPTPDPACLERPERVWIENGALRCEGPREEPCGPIKVQVKDPARCAAIGKTAPCEKGCGRLCWRKGRKLWEWLGCEGLAAKVTPTPTPTACAAPCCVAWGTGACLCPCPHGTPTATPTQTPRATATPLPTGNTPCDRGVRGWCWHWPENRCMQHPDCP